MRHTSKIFGVEVYSKLLYLYPVRYRQQYARPMVQTFDDMLDGEASKLARVAIWGRTLVDLPASATKEHLTNGANITMSRNVKIILAGVVVLLLIANIGSYWFGNLHARQVAGIQRVTPAEMADAMQQDNFYSNYGGAALLFSGTITSINEKNGMSLAVINTGRPYSVTCQFTTPVSSGETISIAAPGGSAERLPQGVLLHNCTNTH